MARLHERFDDHWKNGALNIAWAEWDKEEPDIGVILKALTNELGELSELVQALVDAVEPPA